MLPVGPRERLQVGHALPYPGICIHPPLTYSSCLFSDPSRYIRRGPASSQERTRRLLRSSPVRQAQHNGRPYEPQSDSASGIHRLRWLPLRLRHRCHFSKSWNILVLSVMGSHTVQGMPDHAGLRTTLRYSRRKRHTNPFRCTTVNHHVTSLCRVRRFLRLNLLLLTQSYTVHSLVL